MARHRQIPAAGHRLLGSSILTAVGMTTPADHDRRVIIAAPEWRRRPGRFHPQEPDSAVMLAWVPADDRRHLIADGAGVHSRLHRRHGLRRRSRKLPATIIVKTDAKAGRAPRRTKAVSGEGGFAVETATTKDLGAADSIGAKRARASTPHTLRWPPAVVRMVVGRTHGRSGRSAWGGTSPLIPLMSSCCRPSARRWWPAMPRIIANLNGRLTPG